MQDQNSPARPLSGILSRLPTGLTGAVFWLGLWFCVLYVRNWIPNGFGTFLGIVQFFVGIALIAVLIPFLARFIRQRMLWSLRNKLILTYLLIGLAPAILFVTLVFITAYIAAGQFAIHLVDTRLQTELARMSAESRHRADLATQMLTENLITPDDYANAVTRVEANGELDQTRGPLQRDTQTFINGVPIPSKLGRHGKTPFGLPPWATELPGGEFSGLVLDNGDLFLVAIHQKRWENGKIFSLVTSIPVDSALLTIVSQGLGRARMLPERAGSSSSTSSPLPGQRRLSAPAEGPGAAPAPKPEVQTATVAIGPSGVTGRPWIRGGAEPPLR
ncbi:MAG: hypothetical protein WDN23_12330 [Edaphobacter sp.]